MLFDSAFVVFFLQLVVRGGNRRLLQDIGTAMDLNPLYMECLNALFHFYICNISFSIDPQIVEGYARRDAAFTRGLICATGPVAPAVWDASACLRGPQGTERCVGHAILTWPPMETRPSAHRTKNHGLWAAFCLGFSFQLLSNQRIMYPRDAADSVLAF